VRHLVREVLRFPELRPVQAESVGPILAGLDCVVLAPTAGGKTEAAAFPVLSRILSEHWKPVSALYIAPLRALLNNQEARLTRLTEAVGLTVGKWHGDVPAAARKALLSEPPHVLMTTPESLEVMLIRPSDEARKLLANVRVAIVDEVHAFAADPRGAHLVSILERLQQRVGGAHIQRIGLSATVGDPLELARWLQGSGATADPVVVNPGGPRKDALFAFGVADTTAAAATKIRRDGQGLKKLVFTESRTRAEALAVALDQLGERVWVHHGSVGRDRRAAAELAFEQVPDATLVATSSLELGIDIGDLDAIWQLDAPATVASLAQRLGRTGRRQGARPRMSFVAEGAEDVLLAMALVDLFQAGWVEAVAPSRRAWTVLVHQIFANLLETSGLTAGGLQQRLRPVPAFAGFEEREIAGLISHLVDQGWLDLADGALLLGRRAEKVFGAKNFFRLYAVFDSPAQLSVLVGNEEVGTIQQWFALQLLGGERTFRLAGRAWQAMEIDLQRGVIRATPAAKGVVPSWTGRPGAYSRRVCEQILDLATSNRIPAGADASAVALLDAARATYRMLDLSGGRRPVVQDGDRIVWHTFAGGRINAVLARLLALELNGVAVTHSNLSVKVKTRLADVQWAIAAVLEQLRGGAEPPLDQWAEYDTTAQAAVLSAFQGCLPAWAEQEFLREAFLDLPGARGWAGSASSDQPRAPHLSK
jgi:ATP-dependent Lhr-like helicase